MPPPPITVELNKFAQIEIVRNEIARLEGTLKDVERQIRETLFEHERLRFLRGLHPIFQDLTPGEKLGDANKLNASRDTVFDALQTLQAALARLEAETGGKSIAPAPRPTSNPASTAGNPAVAGRRRFESFEQFKAQHENGS